MATDIKRIDTGTRTTADQILRPFQQFARLGASGGLVLIVCAVIAMIWANSPWRDSYYEIFHTKLSFGFGDRALSKTLHHWINDGLMAFFFLLVGLEIKRELLVGALSSVRAAAVPFVAAMGGMVVPALFYVAFASSGEEARGWGIPMATDIAFALGLLALLGRRVPLALRVFLTSLAIVDDLGALLVIAIFYTENLRTDMLIWGGGVFFALMALNRMGIRRVLPYAALGVVLWILVLKSGVHATLAGVLIAMTIPARSRINQGAFLAHLREFTDQFARGIKPGKDAGENLMTSRDQQSSILSMEMAINDAATPLMKIEHGLHPWIAFAVVPIFALANAGLELSGDLGANLTNPVFLGVFLGLALGKPIGIFGFTWLFIKSGMGSLPRGVTMQHIFGVGLLGGVGFTMSLFIGNLAFPGSDLLEVSKLGILAATLVTGALGLLVLATAKAPEPDETGH